VNCSAVTPATSCAAVIDRQPSAPQTSGVPKDTAVGPWTVTAPACGPSQTGRVPSQGRAAAVLPSAPTSCEAETVRIAPSSTVSGVSTNSQLVMARAPLVTARVVPF
jgi:hypothetical protein